MSASSFVSASTPGSSASALDAEHFAAARAGRFAAQRCDRCGYLRFPPGLFCPECLGDAATWTDVELVGTLWSLTTYHRSFASQYNDQIPYSVGFVELDAGPRVYGMLIGDPSAFPVGTRVRGRLEPIDDERSAPVFEAAS